MGLIEVVRSNPRPAIERLSAAQKRRRMEIRWALAGKEPVTFLRHFCFTMDQHEQVDSPCKRFPYWRPYISPLVGIWAEPESRLVICKARQMMLTWLFCALSLWDAMFHAGRTVILQSKTYDDALGNRVGGQGLLGRCQYIIDQSPANLCGLVPRHADRAELIEFAHGSTIIPIPQGAEKIQSLTGSGWFADEAARQPEFGGSLAAAIPTLRGGGWAVCLSTADMLDGGAFRRLHLDEPDEEMAA